VTPAAVFLHSKVVLINFCKVAVKVGSCTLSAAQLCFVVAVGHFSQCLSAGKEQVLTSVEPESLDREDTLL